MQPATPPPQPRSVKWIRWLDYAGMAALAAAIIYKVLLPHPSGPLPPAGTTVVHTQGKPVVVDLSATR